MATDRNDEREIDVKDPCIIAVDVGTGSLRSILFDRAGRALLAERRDNPPTYYADGRVEQDPESWPGALAETIAACALEADRLGLEPAAIGLTSQRSSVIPVDRDGRAIHPAIMWQDVRTESICRRMEPDQAAVFRLCGLRIYPVFSAVKMRWLREESPEVYAAAAKLVGIHDFLLHALTGSFVTDRSLASRTNLLNLRTLDWDEDLLGLFGVDETKLCRLVDPGAIVGTLTPRMAAAAGLKMGLPVVSAGGDQQCAALGLGLIGPGRVVSNAGTGSYLIAGADRPIIDPAMEISCNVSAVPGSYILEAASPTAGSILRWFGADALGRGKEAGAAFESLIAEAETSPPGARGLVVLPHFKGRGAPRWDPGAAGAILGLSLSSSRADIARAILEGVAAELAENLTAVEALGGESGSIAISGGMTASRLFCRMQADFYGRPVERQDDAEATALGAWISCATRLGLYGGFAEAAAAARAGRASETFEPEARAAAAYARSMALRNRLYDSIRAASR